MDLKRMQAMMQSSTETLLSTYGAVASLFASVAAPFMVIYTMTPRPVKNYLVSSIKYLFRYKLKIKNKTLTLVIGPHMEASINEIYTATETYLASIDGLNIDKLKVGKIPKYNHFTVGIETDQKVNDRFNNVDLTWHFVSTNTGSGKSNKLEEVFELSFDKKYKDMVMNEYLPHILSEAKRTNESNRRVMLYTPRDSCSHHWNKMILDHPSTFETMAMNPDMKNMIIQDLDKFLTRRKFYRRVGKTWKRGYLLHGPPGTGKSSLIAAIANHLNFDVYDIELTNLSSNYELRKMLLSTKNKSIIVIEDIDCSANLPNRANSNDTGSGSSTISLSGMLNFADGLWSSSGEERIIIFTTNHKDKIDPALLRPGRMDMHIHMSYCTYQSFRILVANYFGDIDSSNKLLEEIEGLIENVQVTPAELAEELLRSEDPDLALQGVVDLLNLKKLEAETTSGVKRARSPGII